MRRRWLAANLFFLLTLACGAEDSGHQTFSAAGASSSSAGSGGSALVAAAGASSGAGAPNSPGGGSLGTGGTSGGPAQGATAGAPSGGRAAGGTTAGGGNAAGAAAAGSAGLSGTGGNTAGGRGSGDSGVAGVGEGDAGSGSQGADGCEFSGHVTYRLNQPETWPSDVASRITMAMDGAVRYYNCYADLSKAITVNYKPSVPTAEANVDGQLSFGSNTSYMQVATAMHEVAHTLGVGYSPWLELTRNDRWIGPNVDAFMKALPEQERDPDDYSQRDYITADRQHFWPYGLNQASEHQSEWSLINHVRIVAMMQLDKQAYRNGDL